MKLLLRFLAVIFKFYLWVFRPITIGVRVLVLDQQGRLLLVKHTCNKGWHLPGGGVGRRETVRAGMQRELREEVHIECTGEPEMVPLIYHNPSFSPNDHVLLFIVKDWQSIQGLKASWEIEEFRFFELDSLPAGITPGTRRRIEEYKGESAFSEVW